MNDKRRMRTLKLTLGGNGRKTFEVREGDVVTIGRDPACPIRIVHPSVSPVHCRIEWRQGAFQLKDLGSSSGIGWGGKARRNITLKGRMEITIGDLPVLCEEGTALFSEIFPPLAGAGKSGAARPSLQELLMEGGVVLFRRTPALFLSLVFHLVVLSLVFDVPFLTFAGLGTDKVLVDVEPASPLVPVEKKLPLERRSFDEPPLFPDARLDEEIDRVVDSEAEPDGISERVVTVDPGVIGIGGGGRGRRWPGSLNLSGVRGLSPGLRSYLEGLRKSGLDVAFVMDSTSSMERFINEAKAIVDRLVSGLSSIVPSLRLAMVDFRDYGDEYVTRALEFTSDRYEILNFLENTAAEGGGDREEAVYEGLNRAIRHLEWRPSAKKVVILIGDSGCHNEDEGRVDRLLAEFKRKGGVVHCICVGAAADLSSYEAKSVLEDYCRISRATGGDCIQLEDYDKVFKITLNLAFADRFEPDVARLIERAERSRSTRYIRRKALDGDREWLLKNLKKIPVHPGLVKELMRGTTRGDLLALADYLGSDSVPRGTKWAALYIIRKTLRRPFRFDPDIPPEDQRGRLERIRQAIEKYPPGREGTRAVRQKLDASMNSPLRDTCTFSR